MNRLILLGLLITVVGCQNTEITEQPPPTTAPQANVISSPTIATARTPDITLDSVTPVAAHITATPFEPITLPDVPIVYGRGATPSRALIRLGMGHLQAWEPSPNGALLAIGTEAGIYVFDGRTMQQLWQENTVRPVVEIVWSPDGSMFAARLFEWGNVLIWRGGSSELVHRLENNHQVLSLAWSPDGTHMVVGLGSTSLDDLYDSQDGVAVWNIETEQQIWLHQIEPPDEYIRNPVSAVAWSPRGDVIAAAPIDAGVYLLFDPRTGTEVGQLSPAIAPHGRTDKLIFSPDGSKLLNVGGICCADVPAYTDQVHIYDIDTRSVFTVLNHDYGAVLDAIWSPDSSKVIVKAVRERGGGSIESASRLWDVATSTVLHQDDLPSFEPHTIYWSMDYVFRLTVIGLNPDSVQWSDDSQYFLSVRPADGELVLWNAATGDHQLANQVTPERLPAFSQASVLGQILGGALVMWDVETLARRYHIPFTPTPSSIAWSPDGTHIAARRIEWQRGERKLTVWDVATGVPVDGIDVSGWEFTVDTETQCHREGLTYNEVLKAELVLNGEYVERDLDGLVIIWRVDDGLPTRVVIEEPDTKPYCAGSFSPDGSYLAVGREPFGRGMWGIRVLGVEDGLVRVYDTVTGAVVGEFYGHTGAVHQLVWSPDGSTLATVSADGTIIVWSVGG